MCFPTLERSWWLCGGDGVESLAPLIRYDGLSHVLWGVAGVNAAAFYFVVAMPYQVRCAVRPGHKDITVIFRRRVC